MAPKSCVCLLQIGFETLNLNRIFLRVDEDNKGGIRAYEKAGFVHEGRFRQGTYRDGEYHDMLIMSVLRSEWNPEKAGELMTQSNELRVYGGIKLYAGTASPELAQKVADYLGEKLCGRDIVEFPNENLFVKLHSSVRGQDVYVIQHTASPVHRNLMELLILLQTLRLDSAARITAVVPYLCYGRSDKKDQPRIPITSRLVADIIQIAGADRYMTLDPHAYQIQGFFSIPGDVLNASSILVDYVKKTCALSEGPGGRHCGSRLRQERPQLCCRDRRSDRFHRKTPRHQRCQGAGV